MRLLTLVLFSAFQICFADEPAETNAEIDQAINRMLVDKEIRMTVGLHTPWHVVHGVLAYGDKLKLNDSSGKKEISALDWIKGGGIWRSQPSFLTSPGGFRGNPFGPAFQGHMAQFGGYLSELQLDWATPFQAWNQKTRVWETRPLSLLYEEIKQNVTLEEPQSQDKDNESSWALWALARSGYAKVDETWTNAKGEEINFEKLVRVETFRDLDDAACGGLHGLYAMSLALKLYKATGKPLTGSWVIADYLEQKYIRQAKKQQNEDGSFSADYFYMASEGETWRDSLGGNGHIFEWLMLVLPDDELRKDWVVRGARSVAKNLLQAELSDRDIEDYLSVGTDATDEKKEELFDRYTTLGGYFHAAHGLRVYRTRL